MKDKTPLIVFGSLLVAVICAIMYMVPWWVSTNRVNIVAQSAENGKEFSMLDGWKNPIIIDVEKQEGYTVYTAVSNGRDQTLGTYDDIVFSQVEWNKSQIAGEWIAVKGKEATKGFIKGLMK